MRSRLSTGKDGGTALYRGLLARGVARPLAEEVVRDMYSHELEVQNGRLLAAGLSRSAAIRRLAGRGFRSRAIAAVLRGLPGTTREQQAD